MTPEANMNRKRRRYQALHLALALAIVLASQGSEARACGYHDDVSVARGALNWIYPDSLHVIGAISRAVAERRLPPPNFYGCTPDLFGIRYRKTAQSLQRFAAALGPVPDNLSTPPVSLVLVEPMMWTRFTPDQGRLRAEIHAAGPNPGDLVVVSGEAVIGEIAEGRLAIDEAYRSGLLRLYGADPQPAIFLNRFKEVGGKRLSASHR